MERAAYYGDKPSQFLLSLMHANGEGGEPDRVLAHVWSDLAAERGDVPELPARPETLWASLTPDQQAQAEAIGKKMYARYGDPVAMKRTNREIDRFRLSATGSRAGGQSGTIDLSFGAGTPDPMMACSKPGNRPDHAMRQSTIYGSSRTNVEKYWAVQSVQLRSFVKGTVNVGTLQTVRNTP